METGSGVYTDFQGLARLRAEAANNSPEALRETAAQFEAIFVQMMLKSMRDTSFGGGLMDSKQSDFYREIYDKQIAMDISSKGGLGLGDMLVQQLGGESTEDKNVIGNMMTEMKVDDFLTSRRALRKFASPGVTQVPAQNQKQDAIQKTDKNTDPDFFKDPVDFIKTVWESAKSAASELGLAPEVLAAQAALETGWGKFLIRDGNGKSSNNLFGVKADKRWDGDSVSVGTLEFRDGVMKKENALFRAYHSIEDSFNDYVDFLKSNPRYQNALENSGDSKSFTRELQSAGYATDPSYAEKINNILNGDVLKQALQALKGFGVQ